MFKRGLVALLTLAIVTPMLLAQQKGRVPVRQTCFEEALAKHADELKQGQSSSHGGSIDDTWHADLWHFWSVDKGTEPAEFELKPMVFDNETRYGGPRGWKGIFAHSLEDNKRYFYPMVNRKSVMLKKDAKSPGAGISIRNPLDKPVKVHLEGMIRLYLPTDIQTVWVYTKTDQGVEVLTSTNKEGAVADDIRHRGKHGPKRTYLKLLEDTTLQPGQHLYIVGLTDIAKATEAQPVKRRSKSYGMFSVDCPWGKPYRMHVFMEPVTP
ncbi:MAG: hypothetical protein ACOCXX_01320 [Planctomycetota bacterium]